MIRAAIAKRADGIVHGWDSGASSESDDAAVPADAAVSRRLERERVEELIGGPAAGVRTQPLQPREELYNFSCVHGVHVAVPVRGLE